jgi:hypothetical protein
LSIFTFNALVFETSLSLYTAYEHNLARVEKICKFVTRIAAYSKEEGIMLQDLILYAATQVSADSVAK